MSKMQMDRPEYLDRLADRFGILPDIWEDLESFGLIPAIHDHSGRPYIRHGDMIGLIGGMIRSHLMAAKAGRDAMEARAKIEQTMQDAPTLDQMIEETEA